MSRIIHVQHDPPGSLLNMQSVKYRVRLMGSGNLIMIQVPG